MKLSRGALIVILIVLVILAISLVQVIARSLDTEDEVGSFQRHICYACAVAADDPIPFMQTSSVRMLL